MFNRWNFCLIIIINFVFTVSCINPRNPFGLKKNSIEKDDLKIIGISIDCDTGKICVSIKYDNKSFCLEENDTIDQKFRIKKIINDDNEIRVELIDLQTNQEKIINLLHN